MLCVNVFLALPSAAVVLLISNAENYRLCHHWSGVQSSVYSARCKDPQTLVTMHYAEQGMPYIFQRLPTSPVLWHLIMKKRRGLFSVQSKNTGATSLRDAV